MKHLSFLLLVAVVGCKQEKPAPKTIGEACKFRIHHRSGLDSHIDKAFDFDTDYWLDREGGDRRSFCAQTYQSDDGQTVVTIISGPKGTEQFMLATPWDADDFIRTYAYKSRH